MCNPPACQHGSAVSIVPLPFYQFHEFSNNALIVGIPNARLQQGSNLTGV